MIELLPTLVGYILFFLAAIHAVVDGRRNRPQRLLLLLTLFFYGTLLELRGVTSGLYSYPPERIINMGVVPLSVSLAWVGIIYSAMVLADRLELRVPLRILTATLIALCLDWGMDPVATRLGIWVWKGEGGAFYGIPSFNMVGWFLVPVCYLLAYGLAWDRTARRLRVLTIAQIDDDRSLFRRLYTLLAVTPLSLVLLTAGTYGLIGALPGLLNLSFLAMVLWAMLTVIVTLGIIIWRRDYLRRRRGNDIIPSLILAWISLNYTFFAASAHLFPLAVLMMASALPIWTAFGMGLLPTSIAESRRTPSSRPANL